MVAEVAIGQAIHQTVSQRIQLLVGTGLRNTCSTVTGGGKSSDRQIGGAGERRGTGAEVDVRDLPQVRRIGAKVEEVSRRSRWRSCCAIDIRRQHAAKC